MKAHMPTWRRNALRGVMAQADEAAYAWKELSKTLADYGEMAGARDARHASLYLRHLVSELREDV